MCLREEGVGSRHRLRRLLRASSPFVALLVAVLLVAQPCLAGWQDVLSGFALHGGDPCPLNEAAKDLGQLLSALEDQPVAPWAQQQQEQAGADKGTGASSSSSSFSSSVWQGLGVWAPKLAPKADECQVKGVIGQHIALKTISIAITDHMHNPAPLKPLVFFLIGQPGVGKTLFETMLRKALYSKADVDGICTGIVVILGGEYRDDSKLDEYKAALQARVTAAVQECHRAFIVIDEVQFMADGVLDALVDFMGFKPVQYQGRTLDFRQATFLLTTNEGGKRVSDLTAELLRENGFQRERLRYDDYKDILKAELAKKAAWLRYKQRVDYYIPFLPMGRSEVELAVQRQLESYACSSARDGELASFEWEPAVVKLIAQQLVPTNTIAEGGLSGVRAAVAIAVTGPVRLAVVQAGVPKSRVAAKAVVVDGDEVHVTVQAVPGHSEL